MTALILIDPPVLALGPPEHGGTFAGTLTVKWLNFDQCPCLVVLQLCMCVYVLALTLQVDNEVHTFDSSVISGGILVDPYTWGVMIIRPIDHYV